MLVLTRHRNESITVETSAGERFVVSVEDIRGDKVRLGVQCPVEWGVHRTEVQEAIDRDNAANKQATGS